MKILWQSQPGDYFCIATKSRSGAWVDKFFARDQLSEVSGYVRERDNFDVYFCPHGFTQPQRKKQYAVLPKTLWADLDEVDPTECSIKPTMAIESSPGRFVGLWLTAEIVSESLNQRLSYFLGADRSGWDLTQVLRYPGSVNHKYNDRPRVEFMWADGPTYDVASLDRRLPQIASVPTKHCELVLEDLPNPALVLRKYPNAKSSRGLGVRHYLKHVNAATDRSDVIFAVAITMAMAGASPKEIASVVLSSEAWQEKYRDRRDADRALERTVSAAIAEAQKSVPEAGRRRA